MTPTELVPQIMDEPARSDFGRIGASLMLNRAGVIVIPPYQKPVGEYTAHYQLPYADADNVRLASEMVLSLVEAGETPATIPEIRSVKEHLASIYDSDYLTANVLGNCHDKLETAENGPERRAAEHSKLRDTADGVTPEGSLNAIRGPLQSNKPRSKALEITADGEEIPSYVGDLVHELDQSKRTPEPFAMPAVALQAAQVRRILENSTEETRGSANNHAPAYVYAHEALHTTIEPLYIRTGNDGKAYSISSHILWVGERTRAIESDQLKITEGLENPIGVKLSGRTHPEDIQLLSQMLNPNREKGKLIFMLRFGPDNLANLPAVLKAIAEYAPEAILQYDVHGLGKNRSVEGAINEMQAVQEACDDFGLRLHGVHLEAMGDDTRMECRDTVDDTEPPDKNCVDPQFNPRQVREILIAFGDKAKGLRQRKLSIAA